MLIDALSTTTILTQSTMFQYSSHRVALVLLFPIPVSKNASKSHENSQ